MHRNPESIKISSSVSPLYVIIRKKSVFKQISFCLEFRLLVLKFAENIYESRKKKTLEGLLEFRSEELFVLILEYLWTLEFRSEEFRLLRVVYAEIIYGMFRYSQ